MHQSPENLPHSPARGLAASALVLSVICCLGITSFSAEGATIGLDARSAVSCSNDIAANADFSMFRARFTAAGHSTQSIFNFDAANIAGLDALVLQQAAYVAENLTASEVLAVQNFVASGGSLLVLGEGGNLTSQTIPMTNNLLSPYGIALSTQVLAANGYVVSNFLTHPITSGVTNVGLDYYRPLASVAAPAVSLVNGPLSDQILAVLDPVNGSGTVIVFGDVSAWRDPGNVDWDILDWDNMKLLDNIIAAISDNQQQYGTGCPGSGGFTPKLSATPTLPMAGTTLTVGINDGFGGAPVVILLGTSMANVSIGSGCNLLVAPLLPAMVTVQLGGSGSGNGSLTLFAPLPPSAAGFTFTAQAFVIDAISPIGAAASNGIVISIQ